MNKNPLAPFLEIQQRLLFVFLAVLIYRFGAHLPVPGVDTDSLVHFFESRQRLTLGMIDLFSGGAFQRFAIFALGVMPYITASMFLQILTAMGIPALEALKKEGEHGRRQLNRIQRYLTVGFALIFSARLARDLAGSGIALYPAPAFYIVFCTSLTAGSLFLMWLSDQLTEKGIGNGTSVLIFSGIVSGAPGAIGRLLEQTREGVLPWPLMLLTVLASALILLAVVFVEKAQRRLLVHSAKRAQGPRGDAQRLQHLPFKLNMAGLAPSFFASAIFTLPGVLIQFFNFFGWQFNWLNNFEKHLTPGQPWYFVVFSIVVMVFSFVYTFAVYNPKETAENLRRSGTFIPGIRPGQQTAHYIELIMRRLTVFGGLYLLLLSLLPELLNKFFSIPLHFGGTALLIVVVTIMEVIGQMQTHLMSSRYHSLMNKTGIKGLNNRPFGGV